MTENSLFPELTGRFPEPSSLKNALLKEYGWTDKRIKNPDKVEYIPIDGSAVAKRDARKQLFSWFTVMGVTVQSNDHIRLRIGSALPKDGQVDAWFDKHQVARDTAGNVQLDLRRGEQGKLEELAQRVRSARLPKDEKAKRNEVPHVVACLRKLQAILEGTWGSSG